MEREQITLRLPVELKEKLQQEAERKGDSLNETILRLLRLGLEVRSNHDSVRTL